MLISVERIQKVCDPYSVAIWTHSRILTRQMVQEAIERGRFAASPDFPYYNRISSHAARVAFLVVNGWTDPIQIDVGVPFLGASVGWPLVDGNHRLAAAIYRNDSTIDAALSGCARTLEALLGVKP